MKIRISESQYKDKFIKDIVRNLNVVPCSDRYGNISECVRIPEVVFVHIKGRR
jgi:hypothetical protein